MRLKSLDKYIKDKVQGYKPPLEEDLWKAIEEKLPSARVPNARGSWMLTAAAVVAIAILAPFTMKFYNLTGRNQATVSKIDKSSQSKQINLADNSTISKVEAKPNLPISSMLTSAQLKTNKTSKYRHFTRNINGYSSDKAELNRNNIGETEIQQIDIQKTAVASNIEMTPKKELMSYINPEISTIDGNSNTDIDNNGDSRYPDRKNNHPISDQKWENWQSIYYPFWDNPAYTGSEGVLSFSGDYKSDNTSASLSSPSSRYTYTNVGAELFLPGPGLGIGLYKLSELSRYSLQNTYGLALSKTVLRLGSTSIKVGVSGNSVDNNLFFSPLNYSDQINPKFGFINPTSEKDIIGTTHAYALNAGLWINNPHIMAGFDVSDINQPKPSFTSDATALPRQWRGLLGYRLALSSDWQVMPMAIGTRENKVNQANVMLTVVYKNNFTLSVAYQNIDPVSGFGNPYVYGAVNIARRVRIFGSYGDDMALLQTGINETFVHAGIRILAIR